MLRTLFNIMALAVLITSEPVFANHDELDDQHTPRSSKKRSRHEDTDLHYSENGVSTPSSKHSKLEQIEEEDENTEPMVPTFSPALKYTPTTAERKYWSPFRRDIAILKELGNVLSPDVKTVYRRHDKGNFFTLKNGIHQADFLFDPNALVLSKKGVWETNLERMNRGLAPIGHKGICSSDKRFKLTNKEIRREQRRYRIDLQHIMQKEDGAICEMTHAAHMGLNARLIVEYDEELDETVIIKSSLPDKPTAEAQLNNGRDQKILTNVLHFRKGTSKINRNKFATDRKRHWKERGKEIEKGNFQAKIPLKKARSLFFELEAEI